MSALRQSLSKLVLLVLFSLPVVSYAQLPGGLGGALGGAPGATPGMDADLSCSGRGAEGGLGCGEIGLEETLDLCEDKDGDYICDEQDECPDTPKDTPVFINGCHMVELSEDKPLVLRGVNFEFDQDVLIDDSIPILEQAVVVLNKQPDVLVSIDGHTDSKGSDSYNKQLSKARAKRVYQYFVNAGVASNRLIYRGFGESRPIAPNTLPDGGDNAAGRAENRRVELTIVDAETFASIQQENQAAEAREAEARAAAAKAAAQAAAEAEEEEQQTEKDMASTEAETMETEQKPDSASSTEEFNADDYLDFMPEESASKSEEMSTEEGSSSETVTTEEMPADDSEAASTAEQEPMPAAEEAATTSEPEVMPAEEQASAESDSASQPEMAPKSTEESETSSFDESEYLEFLESEQSSEPEPDVSSTGEEEQDPGYILEVQPVENE